MPLASIEAAIEDFRAGKFVIIVDDEKRENEGDLAIAAEHASSDAVNFMAMHGRGLICVAMTGERLDELEIPLMVPENNTSKYQTAFCISVEARDLTTTGISAADRSATIKRLIDPDARPADFVRPGHTFPLRARPGGVLVRAGQTEAVVDLAVLAGLSPAGAICEVMNPDGTMSRLPQLEGLADRFGIKIISVAQLIEHRRHQEKLVRRLSETTLPTRHGDFRAIAYEDVINQGQHVALVVGDPSGEQPVLVRMHSECLTGDVFGSLRCDCGEQLGRAMELIAAEGRGVIVYLRGQEGRGIGLHNKFRAYELQDQGFDTVEANEQLGFPPDLRHYGIGAQILVDLGVKRMRLLTNNLQKVAALEGHGIEEVERIPLVVEPNQHNRRYLETKQEKMGHLLGL
ncbi:MAG TPA: bifunctional 3,4-dihydroxy-2-butanone-4-phosphate synthase/GTP cyclohydrolase II [Chloroflexota bacterium]|nr:bifunctional 3,4-dihydroxy-2-butanone-4-phosphate synthase/GTP cyclohydrolase II [Chloroflexota bacterium]